MLTKTLPLLATILALASACAFYEGSAKLPGVYRIDIQQGNVVDQDMLDQLEPGMGKNQIRFIMGTPIVVDPFHPNRWEYIYTYSEGGKQRKQRRVTLFFEDDKLQTVAGNVVAGTPKDPDRVNQSAKTVEVPLRDSDEGFFEGIFNSLPFIGEDGPEPRRQPPPPESSPPPPTVEADDGLPGG